MPSDFAHLDVLICKVMRLFSRHYLYNLFHQLSAIGTAFPRVSSMSEMISRALTICSYTLVVAVNEDNQSLEFGPKSEGDVLKSFPSLSAFAFLFRLPFPFFLIFLTS